jgi:hypothetical protein
VVGWPESPHPRSGGPKRSRARLRGSKSYRIQSRCTLSWGSCRIRSGWPSHRNHLLQATRLRAVRYGSPKPNYQVVWTEMRETRWFSSATVLISNGAVGLGAILAWLVAVTRAWRSIAVAWVRLPIRVRSPPPRRLLSSLKRGMNTRPNSGSSVLRMKWTDCVRWLTNARTLPKRSACRAPHTIVYSGNEGVISLIRHGK